jgi:hypothetical protein
MIWVTLIHTIGNVVDSLFMPCLWQVTATIRGRRRCEVVSDATAYGDVLQV